jgi:DNA-binding transcriptional LysR family regulator
MIERISLNSFKYFYYVATHESITIASEKLFVTQGAVSRQIKNIEESLNKDLFLRTGKTLTLTSDGLFLLNCCQEIFNQLDACLNILNNKAYNKEALIISCEPCLYLKWLIPKLQKFNNLNYGFELIINTTSTSLDFQSSHFDLAIRRNDIGWGNHIYNEFISEEILFFIQDNHLIEDSSGKVLLSTSRKNFWTNIINNKLIGSRLKYAKLIEMDYFHLCIESCIAGLGKTITSGYLIEKELKNDLVKPVIAPFTDGSSYYLLSPTPFHNDERKIFFKEWLKHEMQQSLLYLNGFQKQLEPV